MSFEGRRNLAFFSRIVKHKCTDMHACTHMHARTHASTQSHTYTHTHTLTCIFILTHMPSQTHRNTHACVSTQIYKHALTQVHKMFFCIPELSEFSSPRSSGFRCTPLLVRVRRKTDLLAEVTDDGFMPDIIYIDQGTSVRWTWKQTSVPHTVSEVNYVFDKGCLSRLAAVQRSVFE